MFITTCPKCKEQYVHIYVGNRLLGGHDCKQG